MKTLNLSALLLMVLVSQTCLATPTESLQAIQSAVDNFIKSNLNVDGSYQISDTQLDPRLQLPACQKPLEIFSQSGGLKPGRNTLGIRCSSEKNWTIYSVVSIKSFKDVLILAKELRRNDAIRPDHLAIETRDTGTLPQGYLSDPTDVINKQATRNVATGSVLLRTHYSEPTVIKRGTRVNIQSGKQGLLISAPGIAMTDGIKGQQISVKNVSSQRVIQATVVDPGLVTVYF
jgi:flagellar basal body P-ring formation protein FlgA